MALNLPGEIISRNPGCSCENHDDRPATVEIRGETDSFGSEHLFFCDECHATCKQQEAEQLTRCDWCKTDGLHCQPTRDYEEGLNGPVYHVCDDCAKQQIKNLYDDDDFPDEPEYLWDGEECF